MMYSKRKAFAPVMSGEPGRWAQARQILLDHPEITRLSVCAAAAVACASSK
jgi:hypothetical protein